MKPKTEKTLFIDFETFGATDIKTHGAWVYSLTAGVLLVSYRFDNTAPGVVHVKHAFDRKGLTLPADVVKHIKAGGRIVAHNWSFEHAIMVNALRLPVKADQFICTAATARRHGLPGDLYGAARSLGLKNQKDKGDGDYLIHKYSKPKKDGSYNAITPEDAAKWVTYGKADVLTMCELFDTLPRLDHDPHEWPVFQADQRMNLRGLRIDTKSVKVLKERYERDVTALEKQAGALCGVEPSGTLTIKSPIPFTAWVNERLTAARQRIKNAQDLTLRQLARQLTGTTDKGEKLILKALDLRRSLAASAPKKLDAMLNYADGDTVRHAFLYAGTHTVRWAGRAFQPQNLPRDAAENWAATFKATAETGKAVDVIGSLLRGLIIPEKGYTFAVGDFASIEMYALFFLSNCAAGLDAIKTGRDLYIEQAARVYGIDPKTVTKKQRNDGKVFMLAPQYGMGAGLLYKQCDLKNIPVTEKQAETAIRIYRQVFHQVQQFWRDSERAFIQAVQTGRETAIGHNAQTRVRFQLSKNKFFLRMTLPSGRAMYYVKPAIVDGKYGPAIQCEFAREGLQTIWGGVLAENIASTYSRDLLCHSFIEAERTGVLVPVGTVHDELICMVKKTDKATGLKALQSVMSTPPAWASGFPLRAECGLMDRYGK